MRQDVRVSVLSDIRSIVRATARGTRAVAHGVRATVSGTTRASRWLGRNVGTARQLGGSGNVGMMRLLDLHAISCAGDTLATIGLAGTIFFGVPTGEARARVALYLFVTMVPFALLAPVVGPVLDRFRHGRRFAMGVSMLGRAVLTWVIGASILGLGLYPAAFGLLVLSRAYGVARSAAIPRLLPPGVGLSQAGARASVYGTLAGAVVAPLGAVALWFGPQWPLRLAGLIFIVGVAVALRLPPRADSDPPEVIPKVFQVPWRHREENGNKILSGRTVVAILVGGVATRALYGYLLVFLAFAVSESEVPTSFIGIPTSHGIALGIVGAALALGGFLATAIGSGLRIRRPAWLQAIGLSIVTAIAVWATLRFSLTAIAVLCFAVALASGLAKLAVDASIQERVTETVRASAFAHSETLLMLAWVAGGVCGLVPFDGRFGLSLAAAAGLAAMIYAAVQIRRLGNEVLTGRAMPARAPRAAAGPAAPPRTALAGSATHAGTPGTGALAGPAHEGDHADDHADNDRADSDRADGAPAGYHVFRPSPPDSGVADPRSGP